MILIFAAITATPSPSPSPDVCGGAHTNLLAALNRPSIGFSACAVKPHENVAELGYANSVASDASHLATYPQGFLRFGTAPNLELDLIGPAYAFQRAGALQTAGFYDSGVGAKYELRHDGAHALAADFLYTAPTGAAALTAGAPVETVNLDYSFPISSVFSAASTFGAQTAYGAGSNGVSGRFFSMLPSAVIAYQWNPRAQAFVEAFGQTRTRPDGGAQFGMDAAFQYLLTPLLEVDVEAGRTVTGTARAHYAGFGFGARF